jgi:hypothetical protein
MSYYNDMSGSHPAAAVYDARSSDAADAAEPAYTPAMLEAFKHDVRAWLEMDNTLRVLQQNLRERRAEKRVLTQRVLEFMRRYKIDDLNTPIGRLRFQVSRVKAPLSQQEILDRIANYYQNDVIALQQLRTAVFGNRPVADRTSIRRIPWRPNSET